MPIRLGVTQVRHALQQTVAMGACLPYFAAAWLTGPVQICFTAGTLQPSRIVDDVDGDADLGRVGGSAHAVHDVVDRAGAEVDRHHVVEVDTGRIGNLEPVLR